jgi:bifunctional non-homologous end joining protein LigD
VTPKAFIPPSEPVEQAAPPRDEPGWFHEVLFDGYRLQLHKVGDRSQIYSKNGKDFTARFRDLARAVAALPCKNCVIDANGVATGSPSLAGLAGHRRVAWCFDLLALDGADLRAEPLLFRRVRLKGLLEKAGGETLRLSETFEDPQRLLAAAEEHGLEGIISKQGLKPYVSGRNGEWIKVKCAAWRAANRGRGELFGKGK